MSTLPILQHEYQSPARLMTQPTTWWDTVLAVVGFDRPPVIACEAAERIPMTASMTPWLGGVADVCDVWRVVTRADGRQGSPTLASDVRGRIQFRHGNEFLFGTMTLDERPSGRGRSAAALLAATEAAYTELFALIEATGYRHLVRIWNYLPEINGEADGDERYRHFNSARKVAFRNSGRATSGSVPAACALGSPPGSPICIYFIAACRAPLAIENPRQTSAYHYPAKFGLHRPIFSRAGLLHEGGGTDLFISGTASIVGHESLHRGDVRAQTRESLANVEALVNEANRVLQVERYALADLKLKVYVRRPPDLAAVQSELSKALPASTSIVYVQADVCREDLLMEIEATGESAGELSAPRTVAYRPASRRLAL